MIKKDILFVSIIITTAVGLSLLVPALMAGNYTAPAQDPPNGNSPGFLNTGATMQTKTGTLRLNVNTTPIAAENGLVVKRGNVCLGGNCESNTDKYDLEIHNGPVKTTSGLVIKHVNSQAEEDSMIKEKGSIWLRTDL